ncbi:MAG: phage baseplate assembly protein V [Prevotella sp.]|nr:phage baseplate assembly protein V [Prevotella sp.]
MAEDISVKSVISSFDYRLYFGKNIEDPTKEVDDLPPLHAKQNTFITIGEDEFSIVLSGLKFTRKVYEPGLIEAEVSIKPKTADGDLPSFEDVNDLFIKRQVELTIVDTSQTTGNETTIAKNYYVYMMNPQITSNNSKMEMYIKLTIHSYDKLMAIDKYCKAFNTKKLSSGILKKEYAGFGLTDEMMSIDEENLRHLTYKNNSKTAEMIQPYLVQYNETFYDFMVRTANRCGEFFYFEDGKLTLGLPEKKVEKLSTFSSITMQDYTSGPIDVDDYYRDSMKDGEEIEKLNADPVETDDANYPKDTFLQKQQYNNPVASEEYIFPLENEKYNSLNRELALRKNEADKTVPLKLAETVVGITDGDPINAALKFGTKLAAETTNTAIIYNQSKAKTIKKLDDKYKEKTEHYDQSRLVAFSSLNKDGWIDNAFYSKIRKKEEKQHKRIICIDMGTRYTPVKLGDKIRVSSLKGDYIVIEVRLIANLTWQRDFRKFDPSDHTTDLYSNKQSQIIYAIPVDHPVKSDGTIDITAGEVMPPIAPVPMIRRSGPQTAFIVDNDDKKYQGRVRIAYPWQSPNDNKRIEMYASKESLVKSQNELNEAQEQLKDIELKILFYGLVEEKLEGLNGLSKDDLKKKVEQMKKDNDVKRARMAELEGEGVMTDPVNLTKKQILTAEQYAELQKKREEYLKLKQETEVTELALEYLGEERYSIPWILKLIRTGKKLKWVIRKSVLEGTIKLKKQDVESKEADLAEKSDKWDKELSSMATPWVRVAMPMATEGGGAYFKPSKGDEVLVNFDSDNIERPYVVGSVFSKNHVAPGWDLDRLAKDYLQRNAQIALMSPNGQHISFVAPSDGWKFVQGFSPSLKTLQKLVPASKGENLNWGDSKDLNGGIFMGDRYGMFELSLSSHDRKIKIKSPFGNVEIGAFTGINIVAPNGDIKISGKNVTIEAGNKLTFNSGTNIKEDKKIFEKAMNLLGGIGATFMEDTFLSFLKPIDLAMVRSVMEIFLRPIDGTLCVKSKNYVMFESGKGKVEVPLDRYAPYYQKEFKMQTEDFQKVYGKIAAYIKLINSTVDEFHKEYYDLKKDAYEKKAAFEAALDKCWALDDPPKVVNACFSIVGNANFVDNNEEFKTGTLEAVMAEIKRDNLIREDEAYKIGDQQTFHNIDDLKRALQPIFKAYGEAIIALHKKVLSWTTDFDGDNRPTAINQEVLHSNVHADTVWIDDIFKEVVYSGQDSMISKAIAGWKTKFGDADPTVDFLRNNDMDSEKDPFYDKLLMKRTAVALFLLKIRNDNHNTAGNALPPLYNKYFDICYTNADITKDFLSKKWHFVSKLSSTKPQESPEKEQMMDAFTTFLGWKSLKEYYKKNNPRLSWERNVWNDKNGQILFSDTKGVTYAIKNGVPQKLDLISYSNKDRLRDLLKSIK